MYHSVHQIIPIHLCMDERNERENETRTFVFGPYWSGFWNKQNRNKQRCHSSQTQPKPVSRPLGVIVCVVPVPFCIYEPYTETTTFCQCITYPKIVVGFFSICLSMRRRAFGLQQNENGCRCHLRRSPTFVHSDFEENFSTSLRPFYILY